MEVVEKDKYVGDIITNDSKHTKNVMTRRSKGMGVIGEIICILDGLTLGSHYFSTAMMMRQSMLVQVLLSNSETWLRLTKNDLSKLESVDRMFFRRIFQVPNSTPLSFLYLETGSVPLRFIMKMRRVMYLHHILTRREDALITRTFWAQVQQPAKGDWCIVVREDLDAIGLGYLSYEDIRNMEEEALRMLLQIKVRETAFTKLMEDKQKCSKLSGLKYSYLEMQPYLSSLSNLTNKMKRVLFRWRSHTINVKKNMGVRDSKCPLCEKAEDTQYHLLTCPLLRVAQPWNIESVIHALREREIILEQRNNDNVTDDKTVTVNKQGNKTTKTMPRTKQTKSKPIQVHQATK